MKAVLYSLSILVPDIHIRFTTKLTEHVGVPETNLSYTALASRDLSLRTWGESSRPIS